MEKAFASKIAGNSGMCHNMDEPRENMPSEIKK